MKHLGHHLEQLVLHAVPQHVFTPDSEGESGATRGSARSSGSSEVREGLNLQIDSILDKSEEDDFAQLEEHHEDSTGGAPKPIRFKDALGRKFTFSWHLCKTWAGMDSLINQAFENINELRDHVRNVRYYLKTPNGANILPWDWETTVQPNCEISMHMWPQVSQDAVDLEREIDSYGIDATVDPELVLALRMSLEEERERQRLRREQAAAQGEKDKVEEVKDKIESVTEERKAQEQRGWNESLTKQGERQAVEIAKLEDNLEEVGERLAELGYTDGQIEAAVAQTNAEARNVLPAEEDKPFRCPVVGCDKAYKNHFGLNYHKQHGHENQQLKENPDGTLSIVNPSTGLPFTGMEGIEKEKPYRCEGYGKRYKNLNGLKYHQQHSPQCQALQGSMGEPEGKNDQPHQPGPGPTDYIYSEQLEEELNRSLREEDVNALRQSVPSKDIDDNETFT
jgi:hypothetical protein